MKIKELKSKLWFNIFTQVALIFAVFVAVIAVCNVSLLSSFFSAREKGRLKEQTVRVSKLDISNVNEVSELLSEISEKYNFDVEIYAYSGKILYTTYGSQMMDYFAAGQPGFVMMHEDMWAEKTEDLGDGVTFYKAIRRMDNSEYLVCDTSLSDGVQAELRIKKELINSSAAVANDFIIIVSFICFALSIVWVLIFAKRFSKPISQMNDITKDMAQLKFNRRIETDRTDEVGQLAISVNELSDSLSSALKNLERINAGLKDEIEAERRLDVMRREFVANVSHELKTPISIISGYAEGLKCNINPESREEYCDTIIDESVRMNKLVLSLLELSKYESGQIPVNKQPFDISVMAEDMLKRIFKGKNIQTANNIQKDCTVFADPSLTEQVLKAYLENAAGHTNEGGEVQIESVVSGNSVKIEVYNTGSHIENEDMERIWQSFYRGDKSHNRESGRFGLGLSIVSAVMKMHGNDCGVYNTENGVCFWFEAERYLNA